MADSTAFTFTTLDGSSQTIDKQDLIAVLPNTDSKNSLIIHIASTKEAEASTPPTVLFTTGNPTSPFPRPELPTPDETHIIISTGSGAHLAQSFFDQSVSPVLQALFPASYPSFHIHTTISESSILSTTKSLFAPATNSGKSLRIILLSGDGGIVDLVNGLLSSPRSPNYKPPTVIPLPLGTANALYHSYNTAKDNTWGLSSLVRPSTLPLPTFTATFSPGARLLADQAQHQEELPKDSTTGKPTLHGAVVCSWGLHASLVADSDTAHYRAFGISRFQMAAKENLYPSATPNNPHEYKARVSLLRPGTKDWVPMDSTAHLYTLTTLVSNLEKTFTISPASIPPDDKFRLVYFGPVSGDEAMRILTLAYQGGKHVEEGAVRYEEIEGLRIEFGGLEDEERWRRVCVDGKIVVVDGDGWVEVRRGTGRVLDVVGG